LDYKYCSLFYFKGVGMADKKPRVRKVETVRERNAGVALKAEAKASKVKRRPVRKAARFIATP
jgi:hypothetical protein